jgi:hypothetical protein
MMPKLALINIFYQMNLGALLNCNLNFSALVINAFRSQAVSNILFTGKT